MFANTAAEKIHDGISGGRPSKNKSAAFFKKIDTGRQAVKPARQHRTEKAKSANNLPAFTPWKVIVASFLIGLCGVLYIAHVFQTQQILEEVNQLEIEYNRASRHYHEKRLIYDRRTGPREIYRHARETGFVNAGPAEQILIIETE